MPFPGSMTGAPKVRSVKILEELEKKRHRGIYSGVFGYVSIDGTADFSVVIRTVVIRESDLTIGAGGAITHMSDVDNEWEEVLVKLEAVTSKLTLKQLRGWLDPHPHWCTTTLFEHASSLFRKKLR